MYDDERQWARLGRPKTHKGGDIHTLHISLPLVDNERVSAMGLLLFLLRFPLTFTRLMGIGHDSYLQGRISATML